MSSGLVICCKCKREVHQDGPDPEPGLSRGWTHCEDGSAICDPAPGEERYRYPQSVEEIVGRFCSRDAGPDANRCSGVLAAALALAAPVSGVQYIKRARPNRPLTHWDELDETQRAEMATNFPQDATRLEAARAKRARKAERKAAENC